MRGERAFDAVRLAGSDLLDNPRDRLLHIQSGLCTSSIAALFSEGNESHDERYRVMDKTEGFVILLTHVAETSLNHRHWFAIATSSWNCRG